MKLFIYEMASAGGLGADASPSIRDEGLAMLAALVEDFTRLKRIEVVTLLDSSCSISLGHRCRRVAGPKEADAFAETARESDAVLLIAPEWAGLLERRTRQVVAAGKLILGSDPEAIALAADKRRLADRWRVHEVQTPDLVALGTASFPLVCKPRHGAGSRAIFFVESAHDLPLRLEQARQEMPDDDLILQRYVVGQAASVAFLVGPRQTLVLGTAIQNLSQDGRFQYLGGTTPLPPLLATRAVALATQAIACVRGLHGYVGVDLVLGDDGSDWAIEINPRPTTSYIGFRQLAMLNLAEAWLHLFRGEDVPRLTWRRGPIHFSSSPSFCAEPQTTVRR